MKEQIAKHAERYKDHVEADGIIHYAFIKDFGSDANQRVTDRVITEFAAAWEVTYFDASRRLNVLFVDPQDVPF